MGNWDHGRQDLQRKKKGGKSSKTRSDFFSFFLVWHNTKRTSERASCIDTTGYIKSLKFLFPVRTRRRRRAWFSRGNQRLWRSCTATSERKGEGRKRGGERRPRNKSKTKLANKVQIGRSRNCFSSARVLANGHAFSFARIHVFGSGSEIKLVRTCRCDQVREFVQQVGR